MRWQMAWLVPGTLALCACTGDFHLGDGGGEAGHLAGSTIRESRVVEKEKAVRAEQIRVDLEMGAGELHVGGGASQLLEADFVYNIPSWKPEVRYDSSSFRGRLSVRQPKAHGSVGNVKNEWRLKLTNDLPLDLAVRCGAGENHLDLRELTLRGVEMHLGAGSVEIWLGNKALKDYEVRVEGGVGEATIHVPRDVGVVAEARGGLGSIETRGMTKEGGRWRNDAYGKSKATIRLDVKGGIGQINILSE